MITRTDIIRIMPSVDYIAGANVFGYYFLFKNGKRRFYSLKNMNLLARHEVSRIAHGVNSPYVRIPSESCRYNAGQIVIGGVL